MSRILPSDVRCLTVAQPFAWAICEGVKRIENRSWKTNYREPLLIHAGLRWFPDDVGYV